VSVEQRVKKIFVAELGIPDADVDAGLTYGSTPEWDSTSHMVLVLALEDEFETSFEPDELVELTSLQAIESALARRGIQD
jgi:acyl carrier protein